MSVNFLPVSKNHFPEDLLVFLQNINRKIILIEIRKLS